jgi:repressor LexA
MRPPSVTDDRKDRAVAFIRTVVEERGYPPSVRELAGELGILSTATVHKLLAALERDGRIARVHGSPRAVTITEAVS